MLKRSNVWRGLVFMFTIVFILSSAAAMIVESWSNLIDGYLGTKSYAVVTDEEQGELWTTFTADYDNTNDLVNAHKEYGEILEEEGSVLLKNNGALPLAGDSKITLLGLRSSETIFGATIGVSVPETQNLSLNDALNEKGFRVNSTMVDIYKKLSEDERFAEVAFGKTVVNALAPNFSGVLAGAEPAYNPAEPTLDDIATINASYMDSIKEYSDTAIVVVGRASSEAADFYPGETGIDPTTGARNPLSLTNDEKNILNFATENFNNVIVLINSTATMEIEELKTNEKVDSILWIGFPGNYGFLGVADVLNGNANPSGRLPDIYSSDSTSSPAMANFGVFDFANASDYLDTAVDRGDFYLVEAEGIYTGYRYYETRYADFVMGQGNASSEVGTFDSTANWNYGEEVSYPFGYGESYTTFTQNLDSVEISDDIKTANVVVTVTNTGNVAGKEVVQFYAQAPYYEGGVEKSAIQLLEYNKTNLLQPGESQTIEIVADLQNLASYDEDNAQTYILDGGKYYFTVGNDSHNAINNVLAKLGYTTADGMDNEGNATNVVEWEYSPNGDLDDYTFAVSKNKVKVTNQLEEADLNIWQPDTVTYLSRSDWAGTWPKTYDDVVITDEMAKFLKNDTYEIKTTDDTSHIIFNDKSSDITFSDMKNSEFNDPRWNELLNKIDLQEAILFITKGNRIYPSIDSVGFVGGVYTENGPNGFNMTLSVNSNPDSPWYVSSTDENAEYKTNDMGSAPLLAATFNKELAYEYGVLWGNDGLFNNMPIIWGPGLNLHRHPYNGRNCEYYSEDPVLAGTIGLQLVQGGLEKGLIMAPKHYAFNDQESNRNGIAPFMREQKARELELRSFQIAVEGGTLGLMTSFSRIGPVYVGADDALLHNILREEWGFNGYVVSDMVNPASYMTWKESVIAGTTNFDTTEVQEVWNEYITETTNKLSNDATILQAIKERVHQSLWVFSQSNLMNSLNSSSRIIQLNTWWRILYKACIGGSGLLILISVAFYAISVKNSNKRIRTKEGV
jgi:beta-glucosidase